MATLKIRRLGYALGAEITGLDLSKPLDDETVHQLRNAWLDNILLCFPGQNLRPEEQVALCSRFGVLDEPKAAGNHAFFHDYPALHLIVNKPVTAEGATFRQSFSDEWHSDLSYTNRPKSATFLLALELPEVGGNTLFANTYRAYETLSPALRVVIDSLECVHDGSRSPDFQRRSSEEQAERRRRRPPVVHPLVRVHPETGRKSLFVGHQVRQFAGMSEEESKPFLDFLNEHATRHEFVYRHQWTVHDLLMWDNRCSMHYAVWDYDQRHLRRLQRCSLLAPETGRYNKGDEHRSLVTTEATT